MNILSARAILKKEITNFFGNEYGLLIENIEFTLPEMQFGDLSTSICLKESKSLKIPPINLGEKLKNYLEKRNLDFVLSAEVKAPGFLNFYLKLSEDKTLLDGWLQTLFKTGSSVSNKYKNKKVLVEHSSPNLFKPFNIGHLLNNFTGEFVRRIMIEAGAKVTTISYPSDISIGIAKAIYIIKNDGGLKNEIFDKDTETVVNYLGDTYVRGVNEYKYAEEAGIHELIRQIKIVSNNLFGGVESEDLEIYNFTKKINVEYLFSNLKEIGSHFDGFIFESEAGVVGKKIVMENLGKVFEESEGAIIYVPPQNRKDINTTVFINSEGNPTYPAKDLGLTVMKREKYNPDFSFWITDNEQAPHFKTVYNAAGKIYVGEEEKNIFYPHGRMTFKGEKMSSRLGNAPNGMEVLKEIEVELKSKVGEKVKDLSEEDRKTLVKNLAQASLRVSVLKSKPGQNMDFDPERSLSFEGDSGPYLCYTHARICSLLEKARKENYSITFNKNEAPNTIFRKVMQFDYVLQEVIEEIAPQKLVTYLFELASEFNSFYANTPILNKENEKAAHHLYVSKLVKEKLNRGLHILGVEAPNKM